MQNQGTEKEGKEIGSIKVEGESVAPGVFDAGKAGLALVGLDEALRYFNLCQSPDFAKLDYELPVKIRTGSWEAIIWAGVGGSLVIFAKKYLETAAEEMAKRDFEGIGFKDVFRKSMQALVYLIRLAKRTSKLKDWDLRNIKWHNNNQDVGIQDENGDYIFVPKEFLNWYARMPAKTIGKIVQVVEKDRELIVSAVHENGLLLEKVTLRDREIFLGNYDSGEEGDFLFPDLRHGDDVEIEGVLTRGNAKTNSFGVEYQGHIINCVPDNGSVEQYKYALFLNCLIQGRVTRLYKDTAVAERKPTIIVNTVIPLERDQQTSLF